MMGMARAPTWRTARVLNLVPVQEEEEEAADDVEVVVLVAAREL
jgi:hypothetical protein